MVGDPLASPSPETLAERIRAFLAAAPEAPIVLHARLARALPLARALRGLMVAVSTPDLAGDLQEAGIEPDLVVFDASRLDALMREDAPAGRFVFVDLTGPEPTLTLRSLDATA